MAGLSKPSKCECGKIDLHREYRPERWVCSDGHIVVTRTTKPISGICRCCKRSNQEVEFRVGKNFCIECHRDYNNRYRESHRDELKVRHRESYQRDKKKRQAAVRAANQRSPEAFIRNLLHSIIKRCNQAKVGNHKLNPVCLNIDITYDYIVELYNKHDGRCAITGIKMTHEFGDMKSISIDRIDSSIGYLKPNVQLVCQAVNLAKRERSQNDVIEFFKAVVDVRTNGGANVSKSSI